MMELSPLKAIRKKCLDCSGYNQAEVKNCVIPDCVLYPFRMGNNPNRKGIGRKGGNPEIGNLKKNANSTSDS